MFQNSQAQAAKDKIRKQPPSHPVLHNWKNREAFWTVLYGHLPPEEQPKFCVLFLEESGYSLNIVDADRTETRMNTDELTDGSQFDKTYVHPLVDYIRDEYEFGVHVVLSARYCWLAETSDATDVYVTHRLPAAPDDPEPIRVPPFFARCWEYAAGYADHHDGRARAIGTVIGSIFVLFLVISSAFTVFGISMLANALIDWLPNSMVEALGYDPLGHDFGSLWWIVAALAVVLQCSELLVLFRPLRWYGWGVMVFNFAMHTHFGIEIGIERGDSAAITALWAALFAVISTVPDTLTLFFGGLVLAMMPLLGAWLPQRLLAMLRSTRRIWQRESDYIYQTVDAAPQPYVVRPPQLPYR